MRKPLALTAGVVLAGSALVGVSPASASTTYDPNVARVANPANTCKSIPGSIEHAAALMGTTIDTSWFDYTDCVTTMAHGDAVVPPPFGDPYAQCDMLVNVFGAFSYPATLHNGADEEDQLLPDLTVKNRKQCGSALYAFHAIATAVFPEEP